MSELGDLYWEIDNEGFYYYFSSLSSEKEEDEYPESIRALFGKAWELATELSAVEDELMGILEEAAYDEDDDW
jgi:hypothetical protein